jgi:hypothetical protein
VKSAKRVELRLRRVQLILELHLALQELPDLALNLASLLDHHLLEELLTKHGDRHDRSRTTATLVGGVLVRSVCVLVAHAIIIANQAAYATPSGAFSMKINEKVISRCGVWVYVSGR